MAAQRTYLAIDLPCGVAVLKSLQDPRQSAAV